MKSNPSALGMGLKGWVEVSVLDHLGKVVQSYPKQRNLLLDRGLDQLASTVLCDLFLACAKGTGTTDTTEDLTGGPETYSQSAFTVTRTAGSRNFTLADVGKLIRTTAGDEARITAYTDATHVEVNVSDAYTDLAITLYSVHQTELSAESDRTINYSGIAGENSTTTVGNVRTFKRTFIFGFEPANSEAVTGSYTQSGTTVTRASGARPFTLGDVGKYLAYTTNGSQVKIMGYTDATHVTVDVSQTVSADSITLYGWRDYTEVGFSESSVANDDINIRVLLDTPARVYAENAINPSQQLRVTYTLQLTVTPSVSAVQNLTGVITDVSNAMSGSKTGSHVIESFATSIVLPTGATDSGYAWLEPSLPGFCGLATAGVALDPLGDTVRDAGSNYIAMVNEDYLEGTFSIKAKAVFGIDDGVGAWKVFMIYDPESMKAIYTQRFTSTQNKDGSHVLTLRFKKTWGRDLS